MLNNFDRDKFLVRCMEGVALCLLPVAESVLSFRTPVVVAELNSELETVQLSFSVSPSSDGDALRHLFGLPESESDVLPSDSSGLTEVPRRATLLLPHFLDSDSESSLFFPVCEDELPRLRELEESDSYSRPSESSWLLSTLDWESDLSNDDPDLSETRKQQ